MYIVMMIGQRVCDQWFISRMMLIPLLDHRGVHVEVVVVDRRRGRGQLLSLSLLIRRAAGEVLLPTSLGPKRKARVITASPQLGSNHTIHPEGGNEHDGGK